MTTPALTFTVTVAQEDEALLRAYIDGPRYEMALREIDDRLRSKAKYEDEEWAQKSRELLWEVLKEMDLPLA